MRPSGWYVDFFKTDGLHPGGEHLFGEVLPSPPREGETVEVRGVSEHSQDPAVKTYHVLKVTYVLYCQPFRTQDCLGECRVLMTRES